MSKDPVAQIRRFNRLVTQRVGALNDQFLGRDRPLGESRLLYEIGPDGADIRDLRSRLGLDSGYVSRLVRALESKGLVELTPAPGDERVRQARLTEFGDREVREMNARSDEAAASLLASLPTGHRDRLVQAMAEVERLLRVAGAQIAQVDPSTDAARWCMSQYFRELDQRCDGGFDPDASLPADEGDLIPPRGVFLLATADGDPIGCGAVKIIQPGMGSLKRMWVAPSVRGLGFGKRLLLALETHARDAGLTMLRLETNMALTEAIAMYRKNGYREVSAFNDDPYANHWFEKDIRCAE